MASKHDPTPYGNPLQGVKMVAEVTMEAVRLHEVALRDGLQNESTVLDVADKLAILDALIASGFRDIEVTSFVRPRMIPQLSDAAEVVAGLPRGNGVRYWALVPNQVGLDRALDAGIGHIATFMSASETHNKKNVNRTRAESLAALEAVTRTAVSEGMAVRAYISTVFGCPYEGDVAPEATLELALRLLDAGATELSLGDTTGVANPAQVQRVIRFLADNGVPLSTMAGHFHDTRGTALANVLAAWQCGVRTFDGAVGGVGGCPYAPGAAGNVASEDLANLFAEMGVETGVDLDAACRAGQVVEDLLGRSLPGRFHQFWQTTREDSAGPRCEAKGA